MSESLLLLHFLLILLLFCVSPSMLLPITYPFEGYVSCHPRQIQALTQFKNEFDTRGCNHSDYSNGVWCDNSTGAVTKLQLTACLSGTLKPNSSLFKLHHLRYLNLSENNFISSSLPSEFGNLIRLEVLSLSSNGFLGQVPSSISNLRRLAVLDLSYNELTGSLPLVGNLTKLYFLKLSHNHLSGTLNPNNGLFMLHQLRYLNLGFNNFSSSLPSQFGNLNKLKVLSLSSNGFFGQVPTTVSNLTLLEGFFFDQNKLTGSFPLVQNLTMLTILNIYDNHFSGSIPSSLLTLPSLIHLDLRQNGLTGHIVVPNSTLSSKLRQMLIGNNQFKGDILEPISKLINLEVLGLSFLNISYPVDLRLFSSLRSLWYLDLSGSSISPVSLSSDSYIPLTMEVLLLTQCGIKEFPNILKTLQNLESIDISNNNINGKIPEWLWSLPHLDSVFVTNNSFNGFEGSTEVFINSSVQTLYLGLNSFEGAFPTLPLSINMLSAHNNSFTGEIPLSICNRSSLDVLDLGYNNFTGSVPQCLSNFVFVDLRKNNMEGSIPDNFYTCPSLQTFDVGYNQLTGKHSKISSKFLISTFPFWLKALPNLQVLILCSNTLFGPISPPHKGPLEFPELRILEISDNKFSGSLPPTYFVNWKASSFTMNEDGGLYMQYAKTTSGILFYNYLDHIDLQYKGLHMEQANVLTSYTAIDFSGNQIDGQIPESIGLLKALIALNLSNNEFTGHIPLSFSNLSKLESLDLSRNQLSGTIPNGLASLSFLGYINVSHNQLKGEIPQGTQIIGQPQSSFEGNASLCGLPLQESCLGSNAPPTQQPKEEEKEEEEEVLNRKGVVIGYGLGVFFGLAIAQVIASYKPEWLAKIIGLNKH
ncbi:hypothetical protein N665_0104s0086 [Sinapis alba]|nr:hypothetical protein N665_0104s0086 [Sinapis alba]